MKKGKNRDASSEESCFIDSLVDWIKQESKDIAFGEVGVILTKHKGKILKTSKVLKIHQVLDKK